MDQVHALIPIEKRHIMTDLQEYITQIMSRQITNTPTSWKGYRFIPGCEAETAKYAFENYDFEKDSVFIITFPKTGNNWTSEIVRQILYGNDVKADALSTSLPAPLFALEMGSADKFQLFDHIPLPRKMFGSHLPEELFNFEKMKKSGGKVIIVIRNPKDQAVSLFHFVQNNPFFDSVKDEYSSDWSEFLASYMQGKQTLNSKEGQGYLDHVLGWYKHKDDPNILFVQYEDMRRNLKKEIRRMAMFINVDLEDGRVDKLAESTTFAAMKKKVESKSDNFSELRGQMNLMRKGQVGEWKNMFTVAQSEEMDQLVKEKLGKTDIKFSYHI